MLISFKTTRLDVFEVAADEPVLDLAAILESIPQILTSPVVENLPPYFHGVDSIDAAKVWLHKMLSESRLLKIQLQGGPLIGFLFIHLENGSQAHIGYLLAEEYWGKGLASELLQEFISVTANRQEWSEIVGGVDPSNLASAHVLKKLGFIESVNDESDVVFYEYRLS